MSGRLAHGLELRGDQPEPSRTRRLRVAIRGAVQGVGFRPFVYRLARELGLRGWVLNSSRGVSIEVEGPEPRLREFLLALEARQPPLAVVHSMEHAFLEPVGFDGFEIRESVGTEERTVLVLPDAATCPACLREIRDPRDRRHGYAFTNCTHCGPRFTIIEDLPYDRARTTMKAFPLCEDCAGEYGDPLDRRFHAQPTACPRCGPAVWAEDPAGGLLARGTEALEAAAKAVRSGRIVAAKGLGGFHLLADARSTSAVARLRARKHREEKPLALIYPDLGAIREDCLVGPQEERLLVSPERPIVLLRRRQGASVSSLVAPGNPYLGCMLPGTPLHHLLLDRIGVPAVATSGNLTDEPIAKENDEARSRLGPIADLLLLHDRGIVRRVDDSVARVLLGQEQILRRARGYAPLPVPVGRPLPALLALGGHLKNTIAFAKGDRVFLSQHLGDLDNALAQEAFHQALRDLPGLYQFVPEAVAVDLHPGYASTTAGEALGLPLHRVQHHAAHVASGAADNGIDPPLLGVAWDGTGYGLDGTVWGGEFLLWKEGRFEWVAGFRDFPLLGGEKAVREPRRVALGLLHAVYGKAALEMEGLPPLRAFSAQERDWLGRLLAVGASTRCRSVGRLFDGVASLLGLSQKMSFEGQAAMAVEFAADGPPGAPYEVALSRHSAPRLLIDWAPIVEGIVEDLSTGAPVGGIAGRFIATLAEIIVQVAHEVGQKEVVLSGGCFQNALLSTLASEHLAAEGFRPFLHRRVPPNDGGISLGQIVAAAEAMRHG